VHPDGIHFQGYRYLDTTLAAYVGEDVSIRYDPRDLAELRVYFDDSFLCRAICPELAGETIALKDIIRARNGHRRQLRETLLNATAAVGTANRAAKPRTGHASTVATQPTTTYLIPHAVRKPLSPVAQSMARASRTRSLTVPFRIAV